MSPTIAVSTLGGFGLTVGGRPGVPPSTRNARALLACLAYECGRAFPRDELVERFWPEIDPERGRANLATALWSVRRALEPDAGAALDATRTVIALRGDVHVDACVFERDIRSSDPAVRAAAVRAYRGDFLPEHIDPWSVAQRERLSMLYENALLASAREKRDPELAWKALERDPYAEDAYAILVEHALDLGNRATARALLARWLAAVGEIGAAPDAAYERLVGAVEAVPRTVDASALPTMTSSFVGRADDAACLTRALDAGRVVTVTGAGGAGKTRLALHVARDRAERYPGGLHFIDLAGTDVQLVGDAIAAGFGCDPRGDDPATATARAIAGTAAPRLAVVDNCEAVLDALARVLEPLLAATPHVRFLLTSREPLRLPGEAVVALPPLPPADAVALFVRRAREAGAVVGDDPQTIAAVDGICARLDGLPLALELAATRAAVVPLREYDRWLARQFDVLGGARRGGRAVHRTLRALYDDAFGRLDAAERTVFRRMALVAAPWAGDALVAIAGDVEGGPSAALAALWRLVDKSLVVSETDGERARYRLLESTRAYAAERLADAGDGAIASDRHLAFHRAAAEQLERTFARDRERAWEPAARAFAAAHEHVMSAAQTALADPERLPDAVTLIRAARRPWMRFGPLPDAARLMRRALAALPEGFDRRAHGELWSALCDIEAARFAFDACIESSERAIALLEGEPSLVLARSYAQFLNALENRADPRSASVRPLAMAAARAVGDDGCTWYLLCNDALEALNAEDASGLENAEARLDEALTLAERMRTPLCLAMTRSYIARVAVRRGRAAEALDAQRAAVTALRALRADTYLAECLVPLAWNSRACGDMGAACASAAEAIAVASRSDTDSVMLAAIDELAAALDAVGRRAPAATLRGYAARRAVLVKGHRPFAEHVARHAALGASLRATHPAEYALGERAATDDILALAEGEAAAFENRLRAPA